MCIEASVLFVFCLPIWVLVRMILWFIRKRKKIALDFKREVLLWIFFLYIICVFSITFFPLNIIIGEERRWVSYNIIPVVGTVREVSNITDNAVMHNFMIKFWIKNIIGNILLLMPLGVLLPMLRDRFKSTVRTVIFGFLFSLGIESVQLLSGYIGNIGRAFDIDDIILNTLGVWIGVLLYNKLIKGIIKIYEFKRYKRKTDKQVT